MTHLSLARRALEHTHNRKKTMIMCEYSHVYSVRLHGFAGIWEKKVSQKMTTTYRQLMNYFIPKQWASATRIWCCYFWWRTRRLKWICHGVCCLTGNEQMPDVQVHQLFTLWILISRLYFLLEIRFCPLQYSGVNHQIPLFHHTLHSPVVNDMICKWWHWHSRSRERCQFSEMASQWNGIAASLWLVQLESASGYSCMWLVLCAWKNPALDACSS